MGQCLAPCQKLVSPEEYKKNIKDVELFLTGRKTELLKIIRDEMQKAAQKLEFEKAQKLKNSYIDIEKTIEKQKIVSEKTSINKDFVGIIKEGSIFCAAIIEIREGRMTNKKDFDFEGISNAEITDKKEILKALMMEYYSIVQDKNLPKNIVVEEVMEDKTIYESWLSKRSEKNVKISLAKNENEKEILELAQKNAIYNLEQVKLKKLAKLQDNYNETGTYIREKLNLKKFPHIVECYDISHIQGTNTTASRVVFENGMPKKNLYRKYKLKTIEKGEVNDFKSMNEILNRRFKRILKGEDYIPDLIIIDGGKGQLSSAYSAMKEAGLDIDMVSLAKREEEVFMINSKNPVIFPLKSPALFFFQRIRDEAHRFAITFHRSLREKNMLK